MKIVFFSDIHGNIDAFRVFQERMRDECPDRVIFCGDIFGYYYHQDEILAALFENQWTCLLGNHDRYFLDLLEGRRELETLCSRYGTSYRRNLRHGAVSADHIAFLRKLAPQAEFFIDGLRIAAFHGSPGDPLEGRVYPDTPVSGLLPYEPYDYVILGHTHHKMVRRVGRTTVVNPGSLGQQRDGRGCSYLVLDTAAGTHSFRMVEYDLRPLLREIEAWDPDKPFLSEVLTRQPKTAEKQRGGGI